MNLKNLKIALKSERFDCDLTIVELAKVSGVNFGTIGKMENGKKVSDKMAYKVLKTFNPDMNWVQIVEKYRLED